MRGIVLQFDQETGKGLLRPIDARPPRPCHFEVTTKKLKSKISKGVVVYYDGEPMGREATNVRLEE